MLRGMGDVDFLVNRGDVETVDRLLTERGFVKSSKSEVHQFHWAYKKGKAQLELHWDIPGIPRQNIGLPDVDADTAPNNPGAATAAIIRKYTSNIISLREPVVTQNGSYYVPTAFHHGLVLLLHMVDHLPSTGVGLRHLCDWLIFEDSMSEEDFLAMFLEPLQEIGIWTFAQVLTRIGVLYMGCGEREWCTEADDSVCEAFLEDILKAGNFGTKDANRRSQVMLIRNNANKDVSDGDAMYNAMASINARAVTDFPIIKRVPILRPFIWTYVVGQYLVRVIVGKKRSVISKKTFSDAMRRKTLYAKLQLFEKIRT